MDTHVVLYYCITILLIHKVINLIIRLIYFIIILKLRHFYGIESLHVNNND